MSNRRLCWLAALVVAVSVELTVAHHAVVKVPLILAAAVIGARLAVLEARSPRMSPAAVFAAISLVFAVAVAVPPKASNDLWSYAAYGRMVAVHGVSPYDHVPADFPDDVASEFVAARWDHQPSVYGPVFTGVSALETAVAGGSALAIRLAFQGTAAIALLMSCLVVWRRTRSTSALLWFGLNPVTAVVVNGGHNDALVALCLVVAAVLLVEERDRGAGLALGTAALVKATALLGLLGAVGWLLHARRRGSASRVACWAGGLLFLVYLPVGADAVAVLRHANHTITDASAWNPLGLVLLGHQAWRDVPRPLAPNGTLEWISVLGMALTAAAAAFAVWCARRSPRPERPMGVATGAYALTAPYVFPWYALWSMPLLAERRPTRVAWVVWAQSVVLLAALKLPNHPTASVPEAIERLLLTVLAPLVLLAAFVLSIWRDTRAERQRPEVATLRSGAE
jgi:hypothetical protein